MGATEAFPTVSASLEMASPALAETSLREVASLSRDSNSERHFHEEQSDGADEFICPRFVGEKMPLADGQVRRLRGERVVFGGAR